MDFPPLAPNFSSGRVNIRNEGVLMALLNLAMNQGIRPHPTPLPQEREQDF